MENYKLKNDEVALYKGYVTLPNKNGTTQLILTNLNFVFINKYKPLFKEEEITVTEYPVQSVKIYKDTPQIKIEKNKIEIYFLEAEVEMTFDSKSELHKFTSSALNLITGKTEAQRGAKKVKDAIGLVDDTLGIDTVQTTGNLLKNGVFGNLSDALSGLGKSLFNKKKK